MRRVGKKEEKTGFGSAGETGRVTVTKWSHGDDGDGDGGAPSCKRHRIV